MKEYLIVKIAYNQQQASGLEITTGKPVLILDGSIEQKHFFDAEANQVKIKLSDGTMLHFTHNRQMNNWFLDHNKKISDAPKYYSVIRSNDRDSSDEILIKTEITNATVYVKEDGLKMYGDPIMTNAETANYNTLMQYLTNHGVICIDEIKKDLKLIITGNYDIKAD